MSRSQGPRIKPIIVNDEQGQFHIFPGKHCSAPGCGVQLTSRNRHQAALICKEHAREKARDHKREIAQGVVSKKTAPGLPTIPDGLLTSLKLWLNDPADSYAQERICRAMDEYELNARLRKMLPPLPVPSIPVEDPLPIDSPHRLTQGEFLADCNTYGV